MTNIPPRSLYAVDLPTSKVFFAPAPPLRLSVPSFPGGCSERSCDFRALRTGCSRVTPVWLHNPILPFSYNSPLDCSDSTHVYFSFIHQCSLPRLSLSNSVAVFSFIPSPISTVDTDGSKLVDGVGFVAVFSQTTLRGSLPPFSLIYTTMFTI